MASLEILEKFREKELESKKAIFSSQGVECSILPAIESDAEVSDYDLYQFDDVEILNSKQKQPLKETFGDEYQSKLIILNNEQDIFMKNDSVEIDNNTKSEVIALILDDDSIKVGSIVTVLEDIKYKISKIMLDKGFSYIKKYKLSKI